jgi:hypothetical protein
MYIIYCPDFDEWEVKGEVFKVFTTEKMYRDFLDLYNYKENKNEDIYNAYVIENNKIKRYDFGRFFYVEKVENDKIIDNEEKMLEIHKEF